MPVKFKAGSEYKDNYPEFQSFKSSSFQPSPEQAARSAGLQSTSQGTQAAVIEPPIQRKKRINGPTVSLSTDFYQHESIGQNTEFALLGQQEKFASNVQYRPKTALNVRTASPPRQSKVSTTTKPNPRTAPLKPAPMVNVQKFMESPTPPTPLAPRREEVNADVSRKTKIVQTQEVDTAPKRKLPKEAPFHLREKENKAPVKRAAKDSDAPLKPVVKEVTAPMKRAKAADIRVKAGKGSELPLKQGLKDKNLSDVLGQMKAKKPSMNEFAQTDMEKGIADSAPEAPAEYSMKYKAGVAPPRATRKQSEYQREFDWKNRMPSSPMLAADQLVYKSHVGPVKVSGFPKTTEYKAQFKPWQAIENDPVPAVKHAAQQKAAMKKRAVKRSKSAGADHEDKDRTKDISADLPQPQPHHGKLRKVVTEYASNFKAPQKFSYTKGAWHGADPPHLYAQKRDDAPLATKDRQSSWFSEVVELRQRAEEYKKRAQGTHFSREHLVQLMARQADLWDILSPRSACSTSTLSALSLEAGGNIQFIQPTKKMSKARKGFEKSMADFDSCKATIATSENPSEIGESDSVEDEGVSFERRRKNVRKMAWIEEHQQNVQLGDGRIESEIEDSTLSPSTETLNEGRLPTPVLRKSKVQRKPRHHLDRTTPSVGGALLTSPPQPVGSKSFTSSSSQDTMEDNFAGKECGKTYNVNIRRTTPTFGQPSQDTHCLRDDDASVDRPLKATYIYTAPEWVQDMEADNEETEVEQVIHSHSRRKERLRPAGVPSTLYEQMADTYNKPAFILPNDDDNLSILSDSVRSIASSSTLASDVYERTKDRQNFWAKTNSGPR